jgi:hypothetical protein
MGAMFACRLKRDGNTESNIAILWKWLKTFKSVFVCVVPSCEGQLSVHLNVQKLRPTLISAVQLSQMNWATSSLFNINSDSTSRLSKITHPMLSLLFRILTQLEPSCGICMKRSLLSKDKNSWTQWHGLRMQRMLTDRSWASESLSSSTLPCWCQSWASGGFVGAPRRVIATPSPRRRH